jgi:hypothetical protein
MNPVHKSPGENIQQKIMSLGNWNVTVEIVRPELIIKAGAGGERETPRSINGDLDVRGAGG